MTRSRNTDRFTLHTALFAVNGVTTGIALYVLPTPPAFTLGWGALSLAVQAVALVRDVRRFDPGAYPSCVPVAAFADDLPFAPLVDDPEPTDPAAVPHSQEPTVPDPASVPDEDMPSINVRALASLGDDRPVPRMAFPLVESRRPTRPEMDLFPLDREIPPEHRIDA